MNALELKNVHKSFGKTQIIRGVDLAVTAGERVAIIGPNGAGKSTLLRVLAGVYKPTEGSITIEGKITPLLQQSPGLEMEDSGYENIITCGMLLGMSFDEIQSKKYGYFPKFDRHMMTYNSELKIELDKFIKTLN